MDIKKLCYILEIARQQNLSKAAKNLGVSQPALSKYLTRLEEELGTPLFLSRNRQLIPPAVSTWKLPKKLFRSAIQPGSRLLP